MFIDSILDRLAIIAKNRQQVVEQSLSDVVMSRSDELIANLAGRNVDVSLKLIDNLICFGSIVGGAGTSSLVQMFAGFAASRGLKVLVIDLNLSNPAQGQLAGVEIHKNQVDLLDVLHGKVEMGAAMLTVPVKNYSYGYLGAYSRNLVEVMDADTQDNMVAFKNLLNNLTKLYDLVLVDTPLQSLSHCLVNQAVYSCDYLYLIWNESLTCLSGTERLIKDMGLVGIEMRNKLSVVLNKCKLRVNHEYTTGELGLNLCTELPYSDEVIDAGLKQQNFLLEYSSNKVESKSFFGEFLRFYEKVMEQAGYIPDAYTKNLLSKLGNLAKKKDKTSEEVAISGDLGSESLVESASGFDLQVEGFSDGSEIPDIDESLEQTGVDFAVGSSEIVDSEVSGGSQDDESYIVLDGDDKD